jgi:hypothetical protein
MTAPASTLKSGFKCRTPDHFNIAVGFGLQPTARPHPVQVAVDVELQQIHSCRRCHSPSISSGNTNLSLIIGSSTALDTVCVAA